MPVNKFKIGLFIVLASLLSFPVLCQETGNSDSLAVNNKGMTVLKPVISYSVGSGFMFVPHAGSLSGFTVSPSLTLPLSSKWMIKGGIITERYYSTLGDMYPGKGTNGGFNVLTIYGSAIYHVNPQLTLFGIGTKRLTNSSPFYFMPRSSYYIGSSYNFGDFSIGLTFHMSKWDNEINPLPYRAYQGFGTPYGPGSVPYPAY